MKIGQWLKNFFLLAAILGLLPMTAFAAPPVVKTVPWVASNPLIPHDTYTGKTVTLKGTADVQGPNIEYRWDFGDGSPVASGTVSNSYIIEATHAYDAANTKSIGTIWVARLTVTNISTNESASKEYYVKKEAKTQKVEVNIAIDEGLWYLHKTQARSTSVGVIYGSWSGYYAVTPTNVNAFEVNGHLESGSTANPYTETVKRGMNWIFTALTTHPMSLQTLGNPDSNGNGLGIRPNQSYYLYQGGSFMDAIIASGTPDAIAATGPANIKGIAYKVIVQDMVDFYALAQYDDINYGGWRYNLNDFPDNSACQWAAIGLIPAERVWGLTIPGWVKTANVNWLKYTQDAAGGFGYTQAGYYPWGPYAVSPSGMVQMAMDGIGRGNSGTPSWDNAETYIRDRFCNGGGPYAAIKDYYYGLFSFTKSMLLHDSNGDKIAEPITMLQSKTAGVLPIDWYAAETSAGAPCDGVARTLINDQSANGRWTGHYTDGNMDPFENAWAIIMLNRTIFEAGAPVAVASATPNPAVVGQTITLDGSASFHQDSSKSIAIWQWDINNDGIFEKTGPSVTTSFAALGTYPVKLRVTDNSSSPASAEATVMVLVSFPPLAPTANAGGPYTFCPTKTPWFLDGSKSVNPDEGLHQPGLYPGDTMSYAWDLNGDGNYTEVTGATPNVTAYFTGTGPGNYLVQLKVTDTTATSYPDSNQPNLSSTASAQVSVKSATDPACSACVGNLAARPKSGKVGLTWAKSNTALSYNVYRGTTQGGPYIKIGTATNSSLAFVSFFDGGVVNGTTYYYVVREVRQANGNEFCQSNEATARPTL